MQLAELEEMARIARPIDDDEWGSERQIEAENDFFDACEDALPEVFDRESDTDFNRFCLKATSNEMIDEALKILRERLSNAPAP